MKRISILSVCALATLGMMAQVSVIKEGEAALKKKDVSFEQVVKLMTPAFSDPTTAEDVLTYYIPGKAGFNQFDEFFKLEAFNQLPEGGKKTKVEALLGGYDYFMKALPLDTVVDAKGKTKTKYSKEIVKTIADHYNDFNVAAVDFWNLTDYNNAYKAWDIYTTLPSNPVFAKSLPMVPADTIMAEILYNQALAAWQGDNFDGALKAFLKAKDKGYNKKNLYDYAIAVAVNSGNTEAVNALAKEANEKYGKEDPNYIGYIINGCIQDQRYADAVALIDEAIANNPTNAQYYVIKGILFEQDGIDGDPTAQYQKAVELDPNNAQGLYNYGRMVYNRALEIYNNAPTDQAEFSKVYVTEFKPVMLEAVDFFERAYNIQPDNTDNLKLLEQAYYMLNDESNLKYTRDRLNQ